MWKVRGHRGDTGAAGITPRKRIVERVMRIYKKHRPSDGVHFISPAIIIHAIIESMVELINVYNSVGPAVLTCSWLEGG